jgi:hypothetical protein
VRTSPEVSSRQTPILRCSGNSATPRSASRPRSYGKYCDVTLTSGATACYDHFGARFDLTTTWQRFTFAFGELEQRMFGIQRPTVEVATFSNLEFDVPPAAPVFDIWIDDVAFYH